MMPSQVNVTMNNGSVLVQINGETLILLEGMTIEMAPAGAQLVIRGPEGEKRVSVLAMSLQALVAALPDVPAQEMMKYEKSSV